MFKFNLKDVYAIVDGKSGATVKTGSLKNMVNTLNSGTCYNQGVEDERNGEAKQAYDWNDSYIANIKDSSSTVACLEFGLMIAVMIGVHKLI